MSHTAAITGAFIKHMPLARHFGGFANTLFKAFELLRNS